MLYFTLRRDAPMGKIDTIRDQLLHDIEKLPEEFIKELLDYADYLVVKSKKLKKININKNITDENPLLEYIGGDSIGNLAQNIDEELYGPKVIR